VHGRWTPPAPCPKRLAPDFTAVIAASDALAAWKDDPDEIRAPKRWDREACVAAALRFLTEAPAGLELTERSYADWVARQSEALPHTSSLQRYGGFAAVTAEARRRYDAGAAAPHAR
jgi:hypothetical protein